METEITASGAPEEVRSQLEAATSRFWHRELGAAEVVGIFLGARFVLYVSTRAPLEFFLPRPGLWGSVEGTGEGARVIGRWGVAPDLLSCAVIALFTAIAVPLFGPGALLMAFFVSFAFWMQSRIVSQRFLADDQPRVEQCILEAVRRRERK